MNFAFSNFLEKFIERKESVEFLKIEQGDGGYSFVVDYDAIHSYQHPVNIDDVEKRAIYANGCFKAWLSCYEMMVLENFVLMPLEATQELIDNEMSGKVVPAALSEHARVVNNFKARYREMTEFQSKLNQKTFST